MHSSGSPQVALSESLMSAELATGTNSTMVEIEEEFTEDILHELSTVLNAREKD